MRRQSRKTLKRIITLLGAVLVILLAAVVILFLKKTNGLSETALDYPAYDDTDDNLPPMKILGGVLQYQNDAGEWVDLVTLEQLYQEYGGDIGQALQTQTQQPTASIAVTDDISTPNVTVSPTPSLTPMPTTTSTSTHKTTSTPKPTVTVKPSATVKPTTTQTSTPAQRTPDPTAQTSHSPSPTLSTETPAESSDTGGSGSINP